MDERELLILEKRVDDLIEWKNSRVKDRLVFPLEYESQSILDSDPYAIIPTGRTDIAFHNLLETEALTFGLVVHIGDKRRVLLCMFPFHRFTSNFTTNVFTNFDGNHGLYNGDRILLTSSGILPAGLDTANAYYIIDRTATTFKLSLTPGGSEINITDDGTDEHYWSQ